jgi:hypothetical protein
MLRIRIGFLSPLTRTISLMSLEQLHQVPDFRFNVQRRQTFLGCDLPHETYAGTAFNMQLTRRASALKVEANQLQLSISK